MKTLKLLVAGLVSCCALPLLGQNRSALIAAACGDLHVSMAVKLDKSQHGFQQPEPGKALIYFIQDAGASITMGYPMTKIGIDGKWVGANKKSSQFPVSVTTGEHHLCAAVQSSFYPNDIELTQLTAVAGKVYYYRTRMIELGTDEPSYLSVMPVDSDEGKYLVASYPQATAHAR